ncbi:hypothetical protein D3C73_958340 [compost metagenome]
MNTVCQLFQAEQVLQNLPVIAVGAYSLNGCPVQVDFHISHIGPFRSKQPDSGAAERILEIITVRFRIVNIILIIAGKGEFQLQAALGLRGEIRLLERYCVSCKCIVCALHQLIGALADAAEQLRLTQQLHFDISGGSFVKGGFHRAHQVGYFHLKHIQQHEGA